MRDSKMRRSPHNADVFVCGGRERVLSLRDMRQRRPEVCIIVSFVHELVMVLQTHRTSNHVNTIGVARITGARRRRLGCALLAARATLDRVGRQRWRGGCVM
jgi:hypothetical protein